MTAEVAPDTAVVRESRQLCLPVQSDRSACFYARRRRPVDAELEAGRRAADAVRGDDEIHGAGYIQVGGRELGSVRRGLNREMAVIVGVCRSLGDHDEEEELLYDNREHLQWTA